MLFNELIFSTHKALKDAGIEHAFGGALALMHYVREPRTTWDVDVNISVQREQANVVISALRHLVVASDEQIDLLKRDGQVRLMVGLYPLDIFLAVHDFHEEMRLMKTMRSFGGVDLPYISATHLAVLKAMFNRSKDWVDIEEMIKYQSIDIPRALGWLVTLLGNDDETIARFRAMTLISPEEAPIAANLFQKKGK